MLQMTRPDLPETVTAAVLRGARGRCPRCGTKGLFPRYLKATPRCTGCGQDWTLHRADDFPPYIAIFVTGHLMAPVIIELAGSDSLPVWAAMVISLLIAIGLMAALLQPAKGGVIAVQWWSGMHGFYPAGRDEAERPEV